MKPRVKTSAITVTVAVLLSYGVALAGIWDLADFERLYSGQRRARTGDCSLDVGDSGTLHVCWEVVRAGEGFMFYYSRKPAGGEWSTAELVLNSAWARFNPGIAVDRASDFAFIAYNQEQEVYYAENTSGGWQAHQVTNNRVEDHDPYITVDANGNIHLAWITVNQHREYKIAYGTNVGGGWQNQILEDSYLGDFGLGASPVIGVEPDGKAHIFYRGGNYLSYHIHHAENDRPGGTNWDIEYLYSPNAEDLIGDAAVMPDGELHLAVAGRDDWFMPSRGYYLRRPAGSQYWDAAQAVGPSFELVNPKIDADSENDVHIVWDMISGHILIGAIAYSENSSGAWVTDVLLGQGESYSPSFLVDDWDQGQLFYYTYLSGTYGLMYYGSPVPSSPIVIRLRPHDDTLVVGDTLAYTGIGTNTTEQIVWFDYWARVELPTGGVIDPIFGPRRLRLPGNTTDSLVVRHRIPTMAPIGTYLYTGMVGEYPDSIWHSDFFELEVIAPGSAQIAGPCDWEVLGFRGFTSEADRTLPASFRLSQNCPNPFNAVTTIDYELPFDSYVRLEVYNLLGQKMATLLEREQPAGCWSASWDARGVSSGIYFYELSAGSYTKTRRMILVK